MNTSVSKTKKGNLVVKNVRISYPKLFKAEGFQGSDENPRFGVTLLIPKEDEETVKALKVDITNLLKEKNKGKKLPADKLYMRDGDEHDNETFHGHYYVSANRSKSQGRPPVLNKDKSPIAEEDNVIYGGCYCNVVISTYFSEGYGKRCCATVEAVQFVQDGEPFGQAREDLDEVFDDLGGEDSDLDDEVEDMF